VGLFDFKEKRVLVTGASRGIGLAVAEGFAEAGARLTILAGTPDIFPAAAKIGRHHGSEPEAIQVDVSDRESVKRALERIERIDVLVNNAGVELMTPIDSTDPDAEEKFSRVFEINVLGTYYVTPYAVPKMRRGSRIVVTASIWSKTAVAVFSAYCASKHAGLGLVRSWAQELGPRGITVNAVCPGFIETEGSLRTVEAEALRKDVSREEVKSDLLRNQALEGLLRPKEVVPAFLFLASEFAKDITGQSLHVDRGDVMD